MHFYHHRSTRFLPTVTQWSNQLTAFISSGLLVSAHDSGASGLGSSPGRGHCVVFLGSRHLTLTVPLPTQEYKWVPTNYWVNPAMGWTSIPSRGGGLLLAASCYRNRDTLRQLWASHGPKAALSDTRSFIPLIRIYFCEISCIEAKNAFEYRE